MIKPEDLIQVEFSRSFLGYDMKEVDRLLDAVIEQMEAWEKERSEMLTALECLLQEIEQHTEKHEDQPQLSAREKAARIAQGQSEAHDVHGRKRSRSETTSEQSHKAQPLPQAVASEMPEPMHDIPLAKAPAETEDTAFEIPTYLFAGNTDAADPTAVVVEEFEIPSEITEDPPEQTLRAADAEQPEAVPEHIAETPEAADREA